jgi:hypothetical protein
MEHYVLMFHRNFIPFVIAIILGLGIMNYILKMVILQVYQEYESLFIILLKEALTKKQYSVLKMLIFSKKYLWQSIKFYALLLVVILTVRFTMLWSMYLIA